MDYARLREPFPESDIEWRIQSSGINKVTGKPWAKILAYITSRAVMDRLDEVFGVDGWYNEYRPGPSGGNICGISFWSPEKNQWVTKWDGAENTDFESVKGGLSNAMKRAAVHLGIGRYLYGLGETFAIIYDPTYKDAPNFATAYPSRDKANRHEGGVNFRWAPPALPSWALPKGTKPTPPPKVTGAASNAADVEKRREALHQKSLDMFKDGAISKDDGVRFMERVKATTKPKAFEVMWKVAELFEAIHHYQQDGRLDFDTASAWRDAALRAETIEACDEIGEGVNGAAAA